MLRINALLLVVLLAGCSQIPESARYAQEVSENKTLLVDQYYIGVDDIVIVNVWKNPDLSIQVPVRPDGKISVPLAGEILAGGKTPVDVAGEITKKLSKFIRDPQVSVILGELRSHEYLSRVRVTGAVRNPISISFRQGMTVLDVVLAAGGLNEFASANGTKLFRRTQGNLEQLDIDLADILYNGEMATNYAIQPGDVLSIPERNF
ncbi:sugar ABC transporter substrate-binding protein [Aliikangiella marina]|uniref:Sugar ABC transporter substrate-binding protein n=1 Tax=Aliikangiella marina TaxID=1712262 RepID=A0A545TBJ3_9GAMM|nr:XrtA/PEP-CTERM system exopolysaccharide export protein [Aliikangiella marina]TQV74576.1 sugar ABC transporter substrate-binding protein [Aliikangiella marina]